MEQKESKFGKQIKTLLQQRNLSQKQLADDLAISPSTLNNYITDKREPDFKTLLAIATRLDTSIDFLLDYTPPHTKAEKTSLLAKFESELLTLTYDMSIGQLELVLKHAKILSGYNCEKKLPPAPTTSGSASAAPNPNNANSVNENNITSSVPPLNNTKEEN